MTESERDGPSLFVLGSFVVACTAKVERLPAPGESLAASAFALEPGGKGLNLAIAARRLGARVDGLIAIGDDDLSAMAEPALRRADLPVSMLRRQPGRTGAGVGFIAESGENAIAVHSGANFRLSAGDALAAAEAIAAADLTLAQFEISDAPILEAFSIARAAGKRTLLNPSPYRPIGAAMLAATSALVVNAIEAAALAESLGVAAEGEAGELSRAFADAVFERGPEALVVTLGPCGAAVFRAGCEPFVQEAFAVEATDSLGCGDAFAAGLAASLAEGFDWPESARRAAACGALVATAFGVFDALPTRAEVERMLARVAGSASVHP